MWLGPLCVGFVCFPHVCVGFPGVLLIPHTHQKYAAGPSDTKLPAVVNTFFSPTMANAPTH